MLAFFHFGRGKIQETAIAPLQQVYNLKSIPIVWEIFDGSISVTIIFLWQQQNQLDESWPMRDRTNKWI